MKNVCVYGMVTVDCNCTRESPQFQSTKQPIPLSPNKSRMSAPELLLPMAAKTIVSTSEYGSVHSSDAPL